MNNQLPEYNGHENKPTWIVELWLTNDEYSYTYWVQSAENCLENEDPEDAAYFLADKIKDSVEDDPVFDDASIYTDLLSFSLAYVNWNDVAQVFIDIALEE